MCSLLRRHAILHVDTLSAQITKHMTPRGLSQDQLTKCSESVQASDREGHNCPSSPALIQSIQGFRGLS